MRGVKSNWSMRISIYDSSYFPSPLWDVYIYAGLMLSSSFHDYIIEIPLHSFKQTNAQRHFVAFQFYNTLQKSVYGTSLGYIHSMVDLLYRQKYGFILKHVGRKREKSVMLQINSCIYSF